MSRRRRYPLLHQYSNPSVCFYDSQVRRKGSLTTPDLVLKKTPLIKSLFSLKFIDLNQESPRYQNDKSTGRCDQFHRSRQRCTFLCRGLPLSGQSVLREAFPSLVEQPTDVDLSDAYIHTSIKIKQGKSICINVHFNGLRSYPNCKRACH